MSLPPNVSRTAFDAALKGWRETVGPDWVFTEDADVALYRDAYSPYYDEPEERFASAAVAPATLEQVQAVVRTANQHRIPLYPISTGRNLAYGGAAPVYSGSVVLDLKRMNRVIEVSERNAKMRGIFERLVKVAADRGWAEYRAPAAFQDLIADTYSYNNHSLRRLRETLKDAIDPNGILSAGRYGVWPKHLRKA